MSNIPIDSKNNEYLEKDNQLPIKNAELPEIYKNSRINSIIKEKNSYFSEEDNMNTLEKQREEKNNNNINNNVIFDKKVKNKDKYFLPVRQKVENIPVKSKRISSIRKCCTEFFENQITNIVYAIITIYALFADDIRFLSSSKSSDNFFSSIVCVIIFFFTITFFYNCFFTQKYMFSFFFYLDIISILTLLLDISWVNDAILGNTDSVITRATLKNNFSRLGKAMKIGSRGIRVLRFFRLTRLSRISKLYKIKQKLDENFKKKKLELIKKNNLRNNQEVLIDNNIIYKNGNNKPNEAPDDNSVNKSKEYNMKNHKNQLNAESLRLRDLNMQNNNNDNQNEMKIARKLSDLILRRVILLILSMIIGIIFFDPTFYSKAESSMEFGMKIFNVFPDYNSPAVNLTFNIYVEEHMNTSAPLIFINVVNLSYGDIDQINYLRAEEKIEVYEDCIGSQNLTDQQLAEYIGCYACFDNRKNSKANALFNLARTIFTCLLLGGAAYLFSNNSNTLVIAPIESMVQKIKNISINPIEAMQENEKDEYVKRIMSTTENGTFCCFKKKKAEENLETTILDKTISKIGALLAIGFGEAGSRIISKILQQNSEEVNPVIDGEKVIALYAFCDIRNFTDSTEVLQENVMIFVNEIAEIVHNITTEYLGSPNKNIGDAFLLVWKIENAFVKKDEYGEMSLIKCDSVHQIVDTSVIALLKILMKIYKSYKLNKYRKNKGLNERIENYCVKMGFGLHLGWSIEGAIGSAFKIDASYLSPCVNMASKLEEKTKDYGCQLIFSEDIYEYMSESSRKNCRPIDSLIMKLNDDTFVIRKLYTIDIELSKLAIEKHQDEVDQESAKLEKYYKREYKKQFYEKLINNRFKIWDNYEKNDSDFALCRKKFTRQFYEAYHQAFQHYLVGDWHSAKKYFELGELILGEKDGPSQCLMKYMKEFDFVVPHDWKGGRTSEL